MQSIVVGVAQLVEHRVVASKAAGSSPVTHPISFFSAQGHLSLILF